jgi:ubiquinone/menaquinone biosynthesis C-methylase UbiE
MEDGVARQRNYYNQMASQYDKQHGHEPEHDFALRWLGSIVDHLGIQSVLDVGSGTGRALIYLKQKNRNLKLLGVEPVRALRNVAYEKGISFDELIDGDATDLAFGEDSYDLVIAFGMLHHIRRPKRAVQEMARIARLGVFLSDSNNFGQGSAISRTTKQLLRALGLWRLAVFVKTRGRGYQFSDGDGVFYSYSVFDSVGILKSKFPRIHYMNTAASGYNLLRSAPHVAVFASTGPLRK